MLLGANVMEKSKALWDLGLTVRSISQEPSEQIDFCINNEPTFLMYVTGWGDVFLRVEFDEFLRDFRKPIHPDSRILLKACQALISDLYGCASSARLDGLLKLKGWGCNLMGGGGVRVSPINPLDLEAEIYGRAIRAHNATEHEAAQHVRRRLSARLAELTADVNSIHDLHAGGVTGDIKHYIALERKMLL